MADESGRGAAEGGEWRTKREEARPKEVNGGRSRQGRFFGLRPCRRKMRQTALYLRLNGQGPGVKMRPCPFAGGTLPVFARHLAGLPNVMARFPNQPGMTGYRFPTQPGMTVFQLFPTSLENG